MGGVSMETDEKFQEPEIPEPTIQQLQETIGANLIALLERCNNLPKSPRAIDETNWSDLAIEITWIRSCATWLRGAMEKMQAMVAEYQQEVQEAVKHDHQLSEN